MRTLGIIPARGGSKGVINKNLRSLGGQPLVAHAIAAALSSKKLDRCIVSTDSEDIAQFALKYGGEVPFMRPNEFANDHSLDVDVILHALQWISDNEGDEHVPELVLYLRPTTPFKRGEHIDQAIQMMLENPNWTGLRSLTKVEAVHHPYWMYSREDGGVCSPFVSGVSLEDYPRRQDLPACYRLNGVVDSLRVKNLGKKGSMYGDCIGGMVVDEADSADIDTENDLMWCEFLMDKSLNKITGEGDEF